MALVRPDAIKRAAIIDDELDWPRGTALGRMVMLWTKAQEGDGKSVASRRMILEWACVEPQHADRFLDLCCKLGADEYDDHIHFLEPYAEGRYFVVGNPKEVDHLRTLREAKSAAGKRSAEARKARTGSAVPPGASNHPNRTAAEQPFERPPEQVFERPLNDRCENSERLFEQKPNASASASASALASAVPPPYPPSSSEGGQAPGNGRLDEKPKRQRQPPDPAKADERRRRRRARDRATAIVARAVSARRRCLENADAEDAVGDGWSLLMYRFNSWQGFQVAYNRAHDNGTTTYFENSLKDDFRALLLEASGGERLPVTNDGDARR